MRIQEKIMLEILENAPVLIAFHDKMQNLLWANKAYLKSTGHEIEQIKGKKCWIVWGLKEPCLNCPVEVALKTGKIIIREMSPETQVHWPKDQGNWLVGAAPLRDKDRNIIGIIESVFEISKRVTEEKKKIAQEKEKFVAIAESTFDAIVMIDEDGRVMYWNPAAEKIFGFSAEEMIGKDVHSILMHEEHREIFMKGFSLFHKTGRGRLVRKIVELTAKTSSGKEIPIEISVAPIRKENKYLAVAVIRDISERKEREEKISSQLKIISNLYSVASLLTQRLDLKAVSNEVVRASVEVFGATIAWIGYAEKDGIVRYLAHYPQNISYPVEISVRWDNTLEGSGPTGRAIRTASPQITEDILDDSSFLPWKDKAIKTKKIRSSAALPLITGNKVFGALNLYKDQVNYFTPERLEYLQSFAHIAAIALENARLYEESNYRIQRITALRNIDMAITGSLDLRVVYKVALDEIVNQLKLDAACILILNPYTQHLEIVAEKGLVSKSKEKYYFTLEDETMEKIFRDLEIVHIPNLRQVNKDVFTRRDLLLEEGFVSYHGAPLISKGKVLGVLEVFNRKIRDDDSEWFDFLKTLAGQVAIAIDNATLVDNLRIQHLDLLKAYDETIEGWAKALSLKEDETAEHSQRVTQLTVEVAKRMGIGGEDLVHVRRGAILHDIGKIGIPDSILLKHGKLTEEEWEVMKKHPVYAFEMLAPISYLSKAIEIPYCHHEKWDGTGYPRGLKGRLIPLSARIFAVVDVWDALISDRPYRKAWQEKKVIDYIEEQKGKHFDPDVVEEFFKIIKL